MAELCPICDETKTHVDHKEGITKCSNCRWPVRVASKDSAEYSNLVYVWGRNLLAERKTLQKKKEALAKNLEKSYERYAEEVKELNQTIESFKKDNIDLIRKNDSVVSENTQLLQQLSQTNTNSDKILNETESRVEAIRTVSNALTEGQLSENTDLFRGISSEELLSLMAAINNCFNKLHNAAFNPDAYNNLSKKGRKEQSAPTSSSAQETKPTQEIGTTEATAKSQSPNSFNPSESSVLAEEVHWLSNYNRSRSSVKAYAQEATFNQENIEQRRTGQKNSVLIQLGTGPLWIIRSDEGTSHSYLVPKASHRFNQYSVDSFKACFDFHNAFKGGATYTVHAPALVVLRPEGSAWEVIKKGQISF